MKPQTSGLMGLAFFLGLLPGIFKVNQLHMEMAQEVAKLKETIQIRSDLADKETALREQQEEECRATWVGDGTRTILVEEHFGNPLRMIWVLPGKIVPRTNDGRLGTFYGYLPPHGNHVEQWYQPESEITAATVNP
jgi:hypothetical protein